MFEKVNPSHPDKIADRIAGAIVDLAYSIKRNPKIAVEVLIGHKNCTIIIESDLNFENEKIKIRKIVERIAKQSVMTEIITVKQDIHLAKNQVDKIKCGDNGIFKGVPVTVEQEYLINVAKDIYAVAPYDGKYLISKYRMIVCQSNVDTLHYRWELNKRYQPIKVDVNPLGDWTGGIDVDSGATNRKLGSDMGDSVTGGGLHGKDLSKADVSVNIYAFLKAQELKKEVTAFCAIGDEEIEFTIGEEKQKIKYEEIVKVAKNYIRFIGGFEKFAEWGLIR